jgi:hypothetical protein
MSDFKKYIKAVRELYPNALVTRQNSETGECTSEDINGNVVEVNNSAVEAKIVVIENEIEQAEADAVTKKASGKQKLLDLGLSEDEVKAMIGI